MVDAFSLGYVWDDKVPPDNNPNVKRPKKNHAGDKYSHLMNGLEYIVLGEQIYRRPTEKDRERGKGVPPRPFSFALLLVRQAKAGKDF